MQIDLYTVKDGELNKTTETGEDLQDLWEKVDILTHSAAVLSDTQGNVVATFMNESSEGFDIPSVGTCLAIPVPVI